MVTIYPQISIIVPVYNAEKYLQPCIDSILAQTFTYFELLLIDDGSHDNSGNICDAYEKKDKRIQVFHNPNAGVTASRKFGVKQAVSNWILFVDADDKLYNNALTTLWKYRNEADVINASFINSNGKKWIHKDLGVMSKFKYTESLVKSKTYGVVYASLYKKSLFKDSSFAFGNDIKIGEDLLMNIEISQRVDIALNISDIIYWYRQNGKSVMNTKICSPLYWNKFFRFRNKLISNDLETEMLTKDLETIIIAFKNPNIPGKKEYLDTIVEKIKLISSYDINNKSISKANTLFLSKHYRYFLLLKKVHYHIHIFLRKLLGKNIYKILD